MPRETPDSRRHRFPTSDIATLRKIYEFEKQWFTERVLEPVDRHEYSRTHEDQGLVLIFNQVNFDGKPKWKRLGTNQDVNNIVSTLSKLGYNIKVGNDVFVDFSKKTILDRINNISEPLLTGDNSKRNCLIVIFLTHGEKENKIWATDDTLSVDEIILSISKWEIFKDKPKLFIFQACKGGDKDSAPGNEPFTMSVNLPPDVVVYFSSVETKPSHRNEYSGTWLIEELCRNFLMYGRKEDVLSLLHRTTKCVATIKTKHSDIPGYTLQQPVIVSTLRKKFFLTNSKEKIYSVETVSYIQKQNYIIEQLKENVEKL